MKKIVSLFIASLLVLALFASCTAAGGDETTAVTPESTYAPIGEATPQETTKAEETTAEVTTKAEETTAEVTTEAPKKKQYLSLGDSIASGYGLSSARTERYSYLVAQELGADYVENNYGVDGYTSSQLLTLLKSGLLDFSNTGVITVSIGANNILAPGQQLIPYLQSDAAGAYQLLQSDAFLGALAAGVTQFASDLPAIVAELRALAPDAEIVLLTVYNPYKGAKYPIVVNGQAVDFEIGEFCKPYIEQLNEIVKAVAAETGCLVADVYTAFEESTDVNTNVTLSISGHITTSFDPHPNKKGHRLIAEVIAEQLHHLAA
jgi:lysophospholipase L1-like esterase